MSQGKKILPKELKFYHIILLSCLLCSVLILNSNHVNQQREKEKMSLKADKLFDEIISLRKLQANDRRSKTNEVCSRGSEDLIKYYQTGDLSLIDLDNQPIRCEDKDADYMKALRALAKNFLGDGESSNNLRNLDEGDSDSDNIMQYGMRLLAMVIFLAFGVLSIFGWVVCCICNCCNCCCCCCCTKPKCKLPCFIFTYVFYALSVAVSIYGLAMSNKIFTGLADTECSLLQFFDQILYGEVRAQDGPHWAGIDHINDMLTTLKTRLNTMSSNTNTELAEKISDIDREKQNFNQKMESAETKVINTDDSHYLNTISKSYTNRHIKLNGQDFELKGFYVLDVVAQLGKYNPVSKKFSDYSILSRWNSEYSIIASQADDYISTANDSFVDILDRNLGPIKSALDDAQGALSDIQGPFDDVNGDIGDALSDYSEKLDEYGKLAVKLVFSVLMVINIALATFMTLIGLFSMKACANCCFCRCLFKSAVHILWNILALMMVLSFLVGSILGLIGQVGNDMMSLVSFIFSGENFRDNNPLFLNRLGADGKRYIDRCINGDGNIGEELNIGDSIGSINNISSIERSINSTYNSFYNLSQCFTYNGVKELLRQRGTLETNFLLFQETNETDPIPFDTLLSSLNDEIQNSASDPKEKWGRSFESTLVCPAGNNNDDDTISPNAEHNPLKCDPYNRDWIFRKGNGNDIYNLAEIVHDAMELVNWSNDQTRPFMSTLKDLSEEYDKYLKSYLTVLEFLQGKIGELLDVIRPYIEEGDAFSFLNGKFIGTNIKILLKYLKNSLGKDIYTVGVCLVVVGFSLILSISSTILLNIIINNAMKEENRQNPMGISEFKVNSPDLGVAPQY